MNKQYYEKQETASATKLTPQPATSRNNNLDHQPDTTNAPNTQPDNTTEDKTITASDPKATQQKGPLLPIGTNNATTIDEGKTKLSTKAPTKEADTLPGNLPTPSEPTATHLPGVARDKETKPNTSEKHPDTSAPGVVDTSRIIVPDPNVQQTPILPLRLHPSGYKILKVIQCLKRNDVPVNEGTVFVYLIRKEGLPDLGIAIDKEEIILTKTKSLNIVKTQLTHTMSV